MMTQQLGFSILSAPLAAIDRRALSQAWYSALHLAHEHSHRTPGALAQPRARGAESFGMSPQRGTAGGFAGTAELAARKTREERGARIGLTPERRAPRSALARSIERSFLDPARGTTRATFTIEGSNARVHVTLQNLAGGLHLVALCAPSARSEVIRALEEARYALAARGIALRFDVRGERA